MDRSSDSSPRKEGTSSSRAQDYDVVLSYNGKDLEQFFADQLYEALARSGLGVFKDDDIDSRERISSSQIQKARAQSRITIIVFPADFTSLWFLQELVRIVECSRTFGYLVVPVFYYEYPKIRHEMKIMAALSATQEQRFKVEMDETNNWEEVLREASDLMGFVFPTYTDM